MHAVPATFRAMSLLFGLLLPLAGLALTGAHFLRLGRMGLAASCLLLGLGLLLRLGWLRRTAALSLATSAALWAHTAGQLAGWRMLAGQPYSRLLLILGVVILLATTGCAGLLSPTAKRFHHKTQDHDAARAALFVLTAGLLLLAREMSPLKVLLLDRFLPHWGGLEIFLLALYASWLGHKLLTAKRSAPLRIMLWAGFSAVFFGQLALGLLGHALLDSDALLMTGRLHLPVPALILAGPLFRGSGWFMLILFSATLVLVGPAWCSHLCYIGAWDGLASRRTKPGNPLSKGWLLWGRAGILALVLGAALGLRLAGVSWLVAVWLAAGFGLAGVAVMLLLSRRRGVMVHCTGFCPVGLAANLLGTVNPLRIRINDRCTGCMACATSRNGCRYSALTEADITAGRPGLSCTLCGDCVTTCPHQAIHYGFPGLTPASARTLFVVLAVSLHAVFLGVARI